MANGLYIGSKPLKKCYIGAKRVLSIWLNGFKVWASYGIKTITGGTSATLPNVYDSKSLVSLSVTGSSSGSGDSTGNLFQGFTRTITVTQGNVEFSTENKLGYIVLNGTCNNGGGRNALNSYQTAVTLTANVTYTLVGVCVSGEASSPPTLYINNGSSAVLGCRVGKYNTCTPTTDMSVTFGINGDTNAIYNNYKVGVMIFEGTLTSLPSYKPYGYKIGVSSTGNLWNNLVTYSSVSSYNGYKTTIDSDGIITFGGQTGADGGGRITIPVSGGNTYTIAIDYEFDSAITSINGEIRAVTDYNASTLVWTGNKTLKSLYNLQKANTCLATVTVPSGYKYIGFTMYGNVQYGVKAKNVRWYCGTYTTETMPDYQAYETPISLPLYIGDSTLGSGESVTVTMPTSVWRDSINLLPYELTRKWNDISFSNAILLPKGDYVISWDGITDTTAYRLVVNMYDADGNSITPSSTTDLRTNYLEFGTAIQKGNYMNGTHCINGANVDASITSQVLHLMQDLYCSFAISYVDSTSSTTVNAMITSGTTVPSTYIAYEHTDLTSINSTILGKTATTFVPTTVIVDGSSSQVSNMSVQYYSSEA